MTEPGRTPDRGVFYSRDSGGRHEMTPAEYIEWAARRAKDLGVKFSGTVDTINSMIRNGEPVLGDVYFDYCVAGNKLSRPALDALRDDVRRDQSISHIFIPRRDRLARPDNAEDAIVIEKELRRLGVTLVFMRSVSLPLGRSRRDELGAALSVFIEYDQSGRFREDLAQKMVFAQLQLAKQGYSTGGRAPFGFRRTLVREDGSVVRQLADGEIVRQAGHHVVWLPGPEHELQLIRRILEMLETTPASRVAGQLTKEGIPSPDAGRVRKDRGIRHKVSGVWHQTTITDIARNKLIVAVVSYGKRSMGDQLRMAPGGPRELEEGDFRVDGKPKVIRNDDNLRITAPALFDPLIAPERHQRLEGILNARAGTQRGKPRSRDPEGNPLGGRVFDIECCWPMYRTPYNGTFRYTCGLYQQSHSQQCHHNHVDGPLAARFALAWARQHLLTPGMLEQLEARLHRRTKLEASNDVEFQALAKKNAELDAARAQRELAARNLALAKNPEQFEAISQTFDSLGEQVALLSSEVTCLEQATSRPPSVDDVEAALEVASKLPELAGVASSLGDIGRFCKALDVQLYLRFRPIQKTKRLERHLAGGVITVGMVAPPIEKYAGPTGRRALAGSSPVKQELIVSDEEEKSSGKVSRGDRI